MHDITYSGALVYQLSLNQQMSALTLARRLGVSVTALRNERGNRLYEVVVPVKEQGHFWHGIHSCADSVGKIDFIGVERVEQIRFPADGIRVQHHDLAVSVDVVNINGFEGRAIRLTDEDISALVVVVPADSFAIYDAIDDAILIPPWAKMLAEENVDFDFIVVSVDLAIKKTSQRVTVNCLVGSHPVKGVNHAGIDHSISR